MSYVDLIIKYLSGDLSREESTSFEKELKSNPELKRAYDDHSAAFRLIREQLQKRDEADFRDKVREAMSHIHQVSAPRRKLLRSWMLIPFAAASVLAAVILFIHLNPPGNERVLSRYYEPARDRVLLAFEQDIRGETEPGIIYYRSGNFERAMELLSVRISEDRENKLFKLYYLISAIELDRQDEVMDRIRIEQPENMDLPDQAITWYSALALLKSGHREAALEQIHPLTLHQGPYRSDAVKLEKVLLK